MEKRKFKVMVEWVVTATVEVDAASIEEAIALAEHVDLPSDGEYLSDSFRVQAEFTMEEYED